jgi:hypothetical protein
MQQWWVVYSEKVSKSCFKDPQNGLFTIAVDIKRDALQLFTKKEEEDAL